MFIHRGEIQFLTVSECVNQMFYDWLWWTCRVCSRGLNTEFCRTRRGAKWFRGTIRDHWIQVKGRVCFGDELRSKNSLRCPAQRKLNSERRRQSLKDAQRRREIEEILLIHLKDQELIWSRGAGNVKLRRKSHSEIAKEEEPLKNPKEPQKPLKMV